MHKGVTMLQNINLLRWSTHYGMTVFYQLLHGFPGEKAEYYAEELRACRLITHLVPPTSTARIFLTRFSPLFQDYDSFPQETRRPPSDYSSVYPPYVNLDEALLALHYDSPPDVVPEDQFSQLREFIERWRSQYIARRPWLTYRWSEDSVRIFDTRNAEGAPRTYALERPDGVVYEAFSSAPSSPAQVSARLAATDGCLDLDEDTVATTCEALCEVGLMIGEDGKYLSLALPSALNFDEAS
jgi:hypothetical protein